MHLGNGLRRHVAFREAGLNEGYRKNRVTPATHVVHLCARCSPVRITSHHAFLKQNPFIDIATRGDYVLLRIIHYYTQYLALCIFHYISIFTMEWQRQKIYFTNCARDKKLI